MTFEERRRYVRVPFQVPVRVSPGAGARDLDATSLDISVAGVGLVADRAPAMGSTVRMTFRLARKPGEYVEETVLGRVVNIRDVGAAAFGVEFVRKLDLDTPVLYQKVMAL